MKLFGRPVHCRLCWYLEANGLLYLKQIGFRAGLAAQHSVLDIANAIQPNKVIGHYISASFVDVEKAYGRVYRDIAVPALGGMDFLRCIMRVFSAYLEVTHRSAARSYSRHCQSACYVVTC